MNHRASRNKRPAADAGKKKKLARDVYTTLYQKWGSQVFSNIAGRTNHTDAVLMLLTKYNIADPVADNPVGVFSNPVLQNLYHQLVAEGNISVLHAYKVGRNHRRPRHFRPANAMTVADNRDIDSGIQHAFQRQEPSSFFFFTGTS